MITKLNFTKVADKEYQATFTSQGAVVVQVVLPKGDMAVKVYANIPGMQPCRVASHKNPYGKGVFFRANLPVGVVVTLRVHSHMPIGDAAIMDCDASSGGEGDDDLDNYPPLTDADGDTLLDMFGDEIYAID